jgi:beta-lactamase superfamily II metal-dependent hydrolase/DNA invertase Pin-like site-specific DNA recombinase
VSSYRIQPRGAIIYTRVSTSEQADHGTSLTSQKDACETKAKQMGLPVVAIYEDAGISGSFLVGRPGMMAAIADITAGKADTLIVADMSRYSRDVEHQFRIKKEIELAGGRVVFCDCDFDDSPEGELNFAIQGGFKQYERKIIRKRTMLGRRTSAETFKRQPARGTPPFGYHIVQHADVIRGTYPADALGTYHLVPDEAKIVAEMFQRYAGGASLRSVAKWLAESGVSTARGGRYWAPKAVRQILMNPVHKGEPIFGKSEHRTDESRLEKGYRCPYVSRPAPEDRWVRLSAPAIVTVEIWNLCQERLLEGQGRSSGNPTRKHMLSSLIYCPVCGRKMLGKRKVRRRENVKTWEGTYYHCIEYQKSQNTGGLVCNPKMYNGKQAEDLIVRGIRDAAGHPDVVQSLWAAYRAEEVADFNEATCTLLRKEIADLEAKERATAEAHVAAIQKNLSTAVYTTILGDLNEQRVLALSKLAGLEQKRKELTAAVGRDTEALYLEALADVDEALTADELTAAEKQQLFARIVEAIWPVEEGYRIILRPFPLGVQTVTRMLIESPNGHTILIDGGGSNDEAAADPSNIGLKVVVPYLHYRGLDHLDLIMLTHPHGDHVGGLAAVLREERVSRVLDATRTPYPTPAYSAFLRMVRDRRVPYQHAVRGMHIDLGDGVRADVLNPPAHGAPYGSDIDNNTINNYSSVVLITYRDVRFLLDGDAQTEAENAIIADGDDIRADVLKCGHHGADNATSDAWLDRVRPRYAAISCGRHNHFGHPAPATLARLKSHGTEVFRTDQDGAIVFVSDGKTVEARKTLSANAR